LARFFAVVILTATGALFGALLGVLLFGEGNLFYGCIALGAVLGGYWGMKVKRPLEVVAEFFANLLLRS